MSNQTTESVSSCGRDGSDESGEISSGEENKINSITKQCNSLPGYIVKGGFTSALRKLSNELSCLDVNQKGIWEKKIAPSLKPIAANFIEQLFVWSGCVYLANEHKSKPDKVYIQTEHRKRLCMTTNSAPLFNEFYKAMARHCPNHTTKKRKSRKNAGKKDQSEVHQIANTNNGVDSNISEAELSAADLIAKRIAEQTQIDKALKSCRKAKLNCAAVDCVKDKTSNFDPLVTILEEEWKKNAHNIDPAKTTC